jgi:hypothetical protein
MGINMTKPLKNLLVLLSIVIIVSGLVIWNYLANRIQENPVTTVGNTAGNLHNKGLFCEFNGTVYFSNAFDSGNLYAMNPDESNIRKLDDIQISNILAAGNRLYFYQPSQAGTSGFGFLNSPETFIAGDLDGSDRTELLRTPITSAQLIGNYVYLYHEGAERPALTRVHIKGREEKKIAADYMDPTCVSGTAFYYGDRSEHFALYAYDTQSGKARQVTSAITVYNPIIDGDYIYYMDVTNDYRLCRFSVTSEAVDVMTKDRVDCFNIAGNYIYYQKNSPDSPALMMMEIDGSNPQILAAGNFTAINVTSSYVYFQAFGFPEVTYHAPLGYASYETFDAAQVVALKY